MVKYIFILYYLILSTFSVYSQNYSRNDTINDDILLMHISEPPYYKGGIDSIKSFIEKNLKYPQSALKDKIEGTVIISFCIDTNGVSIDHKVERGIREDLDEEAIRVSKLIIFSEPAKQMGKPIKVPYSIPFKFMLPDSKTLKNSNTCF